ncbi:hypothetical protein [Amycolatopsis methanolica]|uniref:hypothetical protein n=1 Tax=Amycolatopsis methanolica TaxID=1814 RepID=UPI00342A71AA
MKTYRQHNCARQHRTFATFAKCAFQQKGIPVQAIGEGEYATVSTCNRTYSIPSYRRTTSVHMFATAEEAERAKAIIDSSGCGGLCRRQHEVVRLSLTT